MVFFIIFIIFIIIFVQWSSNITFCDTTDSKNFIIEDKDKYINSFTDNDLKQRGALTHKDYMIEYSRAVRRVPVIQKIKMINYINEAAWFLNRLNSPYIKNKNIRWKIVVFDGNVELGKPHTRGDMIFMPKSCFSYSRRNIVGVLIHEYIHIYQKMYNAEFVNSLIDNNYVKLGLRNTDSRKNPDLDEFEYKHPNGRVMQYNVGDEKFEHPNEYIAYDIEQQYLNQ
jgi:hypothetical protein